MSFSTTITQKGQMTLPKSIRDELGIKTGQRVKVAVQDGGVRVEKDDHATRLARLHQDSAAHLKRMGINDMSQDQIKKGINAARKQYYSKKYGSAQK